MNIKTIGIFAFLSIFVAVPAVRAEEESNEDPAAVEYADYEDYGVFDDVQELIDEELTEAAVVADDMGQVVVENVEPVIVDVPAPRAVADRLSCDEINTRRIWNICFRGNVINARRVPHAGRYITIVM